MVFFAGWLGDVRISSLRSSFLGLGSSILGLGSSLWALGLGQSFGFFAFSLVLWPSFTQVSFLTFGHFHNRPWSPILLGPLEASRGEGDRDLRVRKLLKHSCYRGNICFRA